GDLVLHQRMQIVGTKARIDVPFPFNPPADHRCRLVVDDGRDLTGGAAEIIEVPAADQYRLQGEQFSRAVRGDGEVPVPLDGAIRASGRPARPRRPAAPRARRAAGRTESSGPARGPDGRWRRGPGSAGRARPG